MHNLNATLAELLRKIITQHTDAFSIHAATNIVNTLLAATCQTRNLLHYKHLDDRNTAEKCLLLAEDLFTRILEQHPKLIDHIAH